MKSKKREVKINKPVAEVFAFVIDPANTPKWIDSIVEGKIDESPPKLGTIYKNRGKVGDWTEYEMTAFEKDKMFILTNHKDGYHVRYILDPIGDATELEYYEWMDKGE